MPRFVAVTSKGLGPSLAAELKALDLKVREENESNIVFESNWAGCYKANLRSRVATGILLSVLDFPAYQVEDIYNNAKKNHDFTKYFKKPDMTFTIQATVTESKIRDQRIVAMTLKDAIADQCTEKWGARPSIDNENPQIVFSIRIFKNRTSISVVTNGQSLSQRGYRVERTEAPLREHLAAGLLGLTGWNPKTEPLVDLMCGSGTFLIEAALMKNNTYPGLDRGMFAFQHYPSFDKEKFEDVSAEILSAETEPSQETELFGFDVSGKALSIAKNNATRADVVDQIQFEKKPVAMHEGAPIDKKGVVVCNPPYGKRLEDQHTIQDIYRDIAFTLKRHYKGWTAWILSGDKDSTAALGLKSSKQYKVFNGAIECRWLKYEIR